MPLLAHLGALQITGGQQAAAAAAVRGVQAQPGPHAAQQRALPPLLACGTL